MFDYSPSHYEYVISNYDYFTDPTQKAKADRIKKQAFCFMRQLDGWCSEKKASLLIDLLLKTTPEVVVEIGVYGGKSLVPMACALQSNGKGKVFGIDPWEVNASLQDMHNETNRAYWQNLNYRAILKRLILKIEQFGLTGQIELIQDTSEDAPPIYNIDVLHIDGNHSDVTSYIDVTKWVPLVKSGGWIIFDDMTWYENGKFTNARAVEWLNKQCIPIQKFHDNCDWGIWQKP